MMVLSAMAPLFVLWAIQGNHLVPDIWFIGGCAAMVVVPNAVLGTRILIARRQKDELPVTIGTSEDHRVHLIAYLFSMLLPFYRQELDGWRDLTAIALALSFIVFLFWHLNLHYLNLFFAVRGYRVYTVYPPPDENPYSSKRSFVLITRRTHLSHGERIVALRLSQLVYLEEKS